MIVEESHPEAIFRKAHVRKTELKQIFLPRIEFEQATEPGDDLGIVLPLTLHDPIPTGPVQFRAGFRKAVTTHAPRQALTDSAAVSGTAGPAMTIETSDRQNSTFPIERSSGSR